MRQKWNEDSNGEGSLGVRDSSQDDYLSIQTLLLTKSFFEPPKGAVAGAHMELGTATLTSKELVLGMLLQHCGGLRRKGLTC